MHDRLLNEIEDMEIDNSIMELKIKKLERRNVKLDFLLCEEIDKNLKLQGELDDLRLKCDKLEEENTRLKHHLDANQFLRFYSDDRGCMFKIDIEEVL